MPMIPGVVMGVYNDLESAAKVDCRNLVFLQDAYKDMSFIQHGLLSNPLTLLMTVIILFLVASE